MQLGRLTSSLGCAPKRIWQLSYALCGHYGLRNQRRHGELKMTIYKAAVWAKDIRHSTFGSYLTHRTGLRDFTTQMAGSDTGVGEGKHWCRLLWFGKSWSDGVCPPRPQWSIQGGTSHLVWGNLWCTHYGSLGGTGWCQIGGTSWLSTNTSRDWLPRDSPALEEKGFTAFYC